MCLKFFLQTEILNCEQIKCSEIYSSNMTTCIKCCSMNSFAKALDLELLHFLGKQRPLLCWTENYSDTNKPKVLTNRFV